MKTAKIKLPEFRISLAAVGRRLSSVILRASEERLSGEDFFDTINAVFNSCISEDYSPDPEARVDAEVLAEEQTEIDKSARRSAAARRAAQRRRQMREAREKGMEMIRPAAPQAAVTAATAVVEVAAEEEPELQSADSKYDAYGARRVWY